MMMMNTVLDNIADIDPIAQFRNEGDSMATGVENLGQILPFLPCKIMGGMGEVSELLSRVWLRTQPLIYFLIAGAPLFGLGGWTIVGQPKQRTSLSLNSLARQSTVRAPSSSCFLARCRTSSQHPTCGFKFLTSQTSVVGITASGQCYRSESVSSLCETSISWGDVWLTVGQAFSRRSLIKRLMTLISSDLGWRHELDQRRTVWRAGVMFYYCTCITVFTLYTMFHSNARVDNDDSLPRCIYAGRSSRRQTCPSVRPSVTRVNYCNKTKAPSEKRSIMTNRKSPTSFPISLRWTSYVAPNPQKGAPKAQIWPIICNNFETVRDRM